MFTKSKRDKLKKKLRKVRENPELNEKSDLANPRKEYEAYEGQVSDFSHIMDLVNQCNRDNRTIIDCEEVITKKSSASVDWLYMPISTSLGVATDHESNLLIVPEWHLNVKKIIRIFT